MKQQFMLHRLNETAFVSFSPTALTATETCGPKISQRILVGFETSDITPGCSVQAGSVTFVSGFSPMVSVNHVLTFLPQSFFKISNDTEVVDAVEQALQSFEDVDNNALLKGGGSWRLFRQLNSSVPSCGLSGLLLASSFLSSSR